MAKQKQTPNDTNIIYYYPEDIPSDVALLNTDACLNPPEFSDRSCPECGFVVNCVYREKYKYRKLS